MTSIMITVQEVRWPAPGKKTGIVADTTGKWWRVWPNMLNQFQQGVSYQITDIDTNEFQGKTYYTIKAATPMSGMEAPQSRINQSMSAFPGFTPPASQTSVSDIQRRMDIFVCGAFNNLMANPNVNPLDFDMMAMIDTIHKLKGAWMGVFGPSPLPRRNDPISSGPSPTPQSPSQGYLPKDDMNDDIPFNPEFR